MFIATRSTAREIVFVVEYEPESTHGEFATP
jgi:hypothetical protein